VSLPLVSRDRGVGGVARGARWSHEEIWKFPKRSRKRNLERRDRVKDFETSTERKPLYRRNHRLDILALTAFFVVGRRGGDGG